ncbi:hypothetical protein Tco_0846288 [Tanacetum coccineum]
MVVAINKAPAGYKAPSSGKARTVLLDEFIESIGLSDVLLVVTDNAANCKAAREEVEKGAKIGEVYERIDNMVGEIKDVMQNVYNSYVPGVKKIVLASSETPKLSEIAKKVLSQLTRSRPLPDFEEYVVSTSADTPIRYFSQLYEETLFPSNTPYLEKPIRRIQWRLMNIPK